LLSPITYCRQQDKIEADKKDDRRRHGLAHLMQEPRADATGEAGAASDWLSGRGTAGGEERFTPHPWLLRFLVGDMYTILPAIAEHVAILRTKVLAVTPCAMTQVRPSSPPPI
jgi:hypothetical protein